VPALDRRNRGREHAKKLEDIHRPVERSGRTPPERSQDYSAFVRRVTCDAQNHFAFSGLPDGAWFVITVAKPVTPGAAGRDVAIMRRVVLKGGQVAKVKL